MPELQLLDLAPGECGDRAEVRGQESGVAPHAAAAAGRDRRPFDGAWACGDTMTCYICKKGFAKPPEPCSGCGGLTCKDCLVEDFPPGLWEIRFNVERGRTGTLRVRLCKNCVAEKRLTEDV